MTTLIQTTRRRESERYSVHCCRRGHRTCNRRHYPSAAAGPDRFPQIFYKEKQNISSKTSVFNLESIARRKHNPTSPEISTDCAHPQRQQPWPPKELPPHCTDLPSHQDIRKGSPNKDGRVHGGNETFSMQDNTDFGVVGHASASSWSITATS